MHRVKVDPEVSELSRGNELSRDHVNRPLEASCIANKKKHIIQNFLKSLKNLDIVSYPTASFCCTGGLFLIIVWEAKHSGVYLT